MFHELTISNKSCPVVHCQSPFTAHRITHCGYIAYHLLLVGIIQYFFPFLSISAADIQQWYNIQYGSLIKVNCNTLVPFSIVLAPTTASGWVVLNSAVSATSSRIICQLSVSMLIISSSDRSRTSCSLSPDTSGTVNSTVGFSMIYSALKACASYFFTKW